jgi:hypothetical protein
MNISFSTVIVGGKRSSANLLIALKNTKSILFSSSLYNVVTGEGNLGMTLILVDIYIYIYIYIYASIILIIGHII